MRYLMIFPLYLFFLGGNISAQSLSRQVIGSLGGVKSELSFTVGESVINTGQSGSFILTQGFHQSNQNSVNIDKDLEALVNYKLFPNPAKNLINLELQTSRPLNLQVSIVDIRGREIHPASPMEVFDLERKSFDLSRISSGIYVVQILNQKGQVLHSLKFKRVD